MRGKRCRINVFPNATDARFYFAKLISLSSRAHLYFAKLFERFYLTVIPHAELQGRSGSDWPFNMLSLAVLLSKCCLQNAPLKIMVHLQNVESFKMFFLKKFLSRVDTSPVKNQSIKVFYRQNALHSPVNDALHSARFKGYSHVRETRA